MKKEGNIFILNSKDLDFEKIEVKGQPKVFLTTTITTGDKDLVGDVVTENCMESMVKQLKDRTIKLDFEHEAFRGESLTETEIAKTRVPLGKRVSFERGTKGVDVTWELNPAWKKFDSKGGVVYSFDDIVNNVENKFYDGTSIAYIPTQTKEVKGEDGSQTRLLDDVVLLNVALTGNPVNTHASVNEIFMKSLDYLKGKKEDEDEEEEKKKCPEKKDSNSIKFNREVKMTEDNVEAQETQEAPAEETQEQAEAPEAKEPEQKDEPEAPAEEAKEEGDAEVKALKAQVDAQAKEIQELKSVLEKPQVKGKQEQMKATDTKSETIMPLDLIA